MPQKLVVRVMPPNQYPHALHEALVEALAKRGEWAPIISFATEADAKQFQRKVYTFAHCFERFPFGDPVTAKCLREAQLRIASGIKLEGGEWVVRLRVVPDVKAMINSSHVLGETD
jgi:hypothetical protein